MKKRRRNPNGDPYNSSPVKPAKADPWKQEAVKKDRSSRRDSTETSTDASVRSPTRTSTSTKADTRGNITVTGGAGRGATTTVTLRRNPDERKSDAYLQGLYDGWHFKTSKPSGGGRKTPEQKADYKAGYNVGKARNTPRSNPSRASVIYAQRKGRKGEVMYWDGKKFTNNHSPHYFGTHDRARGKAQELVRRFSVLRSYKVWVGPPLTSLRRRNPESRTDAKLDEAARRLEDFSGHAARKVITVQPRSNERTGLIVGELDLIGYRTKRDGIGGGKLLRYAHDFKAGSRPLLAVSSDGKQLHIVGGRYEFTEAGIEDR